MPQIPAAVDHAVKDILKTTATRISELIVRDIVKGVYAPGSRLRIAEIAERYGTSHMPVRDALRQLDGDKIIQITLRRGATVRPVDRKFVQDMYELRSVIEVLLVRKCVENITVEDESQLKFHEQAYVAAAKGGDSETILEANRLLHSYMYSVADNVQAARLINEGWPLVNAVRVKFGYGKSRMAEVIKEHRALVRALCQRDRERAVEVATAHCEAAMENLLKRM